MVSAFVGKALALAALNYGAPAASPVSRLQDAKQDAPAPSAQGQRVNPSYFNPQLAIVGDFAGVLNDSSGAKRHFDFREIELGFAGDVDPFLRAQMFLAVAKEDGETKLEVEEAFGQYSRLGKGFSAKFGKFAAAIGRIQRNHIDQLDYNDLPMVTRDTLGDEGLRQPGASLSYLFPGDRFNEVTFELVDAGDEGPMLNGSSLNAPVYVGHYRTFFDFSEDMSGQLGLTYASGPAIGSGNRGDMFGVDYTMKWHPGTKGRSALFEGEAYWSKPGGFSKRTVGAFGRLVYEVAPRWHVTAGLDYSEIPGTTNLHRSALAGVTFKLTEFEHWRIEWQRISSNFEPSRDLLTLQWQWLIGAHPAHKY